MTRVAGWWQVFGLMVFVLMPSVAAAQQMDGHRGYVAVNGGLQALATDFTDAATFSGPGSVYAEMTSGAATSEPSGFDAAYRIESGPRVEISGGVRLWRNVGVGATVSRHTGRGDASVAEVSGRLPHPFFLGSPRAIAASIPLDHDERALHLHALVTVPVNSAFAVTVFGGPTIFTAWQDVVTDVGFSHSYPYDDAAFGEAVIEEQSQSKVGFHVGADLAYYFTDTVGVGWLARFSAATIDLPSAGDRAVAVPAGGFHVAGGLRLRF